MISSQKAGNLNQQTTLKRKPFTIMGALCSPHFIKTPNNRRYRLNERRDDDIGVYMYWMLRLASNGRYDVLKRIDPRYCEA